MQSAGESMEDQDEMTEDKDEREPESEVLAQGRPGRPGAPPGRVSGGLPGGG